MLEKTYTEVAITKDREEEERQKRLNTEKMLESKLNNLSEDISS